MMTVFVCVEKKKHCPFRIIDIEDNTRDNTTNCIFFLENIGN